MLGKGRGDKICLEAEKRAEKSKMEIEGKKKEKRTSLDSEVLVGVADASDERCHQHGRVRHAVEELAGTHTQINTQPVQTHTFLTHTHRNHTKTHTHKHTFTIIHAHRQTKNTHTYTSLYIGFFCCRMGAVFY